MSRFNLQVRTYSLVLALIGVAVTFALTPDGVRDRSAAPVQQHQHSGVAGHQAEAASAAGGGSPDKRISQTFEIQFERMGKVVALAKPVANWPDATCMRTDEPWSPVTDLLNIGIPEQLERPIGYSALDHCTPIFIDRGGKHSDLDLPRGSRFVTEGFYQKTATGGRIEVNPIALMQETERYRAAVLSHEELHAALAWLDPVSLNQAVLPARIVGKARTRLREAGYEAAEIDDEILPRLLTHDPDGIGVTGVTEEDRIIGDAMRRLLAISQTDPELKRVYWQLQWSHALTHGVMSGKAGIGALVAVDNAHPILGAPRRPPLF